MRGKFIAMAALAVILLGACGGGGGDSSGDRVIDRADLVGYWDKPSVNGTDTYQLSFSLNYTFGLDVQSDGIPDVWGAYALNDYIITFYDSGGYNPCIDGQGQAIPGEYNITLENGTLTFDQRFDDCIRREDILLGDWTRH